MKYKSLLVFSVLLAAIAVSCSKENASGNLPTGIDIEVGENSALFILNQGAWPGGSTLDLKNLSSGAFSANWFAAANPDVTQGLGNTGNDMAVIGGKLWALMNGSNQIAIINPSTGKLEKVLDVDSPRYIIKKGNYAYVTSYGAAVNGSVYGVKGKVYRIDPATYETKTVEVGYQPDGITALGEKLYVANSGGYQTEHENTISVIDLASFSVIGSIELPGVTELVFFEPQPTRPDTEMTTIIITETALYIILKNTFLFIRTPIQNLSVLVSYIITMHLYLQEIPACGCLRM